MVTPAPTVPVGSCACGCGARVKPDHRRFARGHNPQKPPLGSPPCRACGRSSGRQPRQLKSYDPATHTYTCSSCRDRTKQLVVTCRHCGAQSSVQEGRARSLETLVTGPNGATYVCLTCFRPAAANAARATFLSRHYGVRSSDPPDFKRAAMADHLQGVVRHAGGYAALLPRARAANTGALSPGGQRRRAIGLLLSKRARTRRFCLCPLCWKLIVLTPFTVRRQRPGFHGTCRRQWEQGDAYRTWREKVGYPWAPLFEHRRRRFPAPMPPGPAGRRASPQHLEQQFRWLLQHYGRRESWRDIARSELLTHSAIRNGVLTLIARLPDTWSTVFGGRPPGPSLDEILPIEQLRRAAGGPDT